jgi:hypothetical protein
MEFAAFHISLQSLLGENRTASREYAVDCSRARSESAALTVDDVQRRSSGTRSDERAVRLNGRFDASAARAERPAARAFWTSDTVTVYVPQEGYACDSYNISMRAVLHALVAWRMNALLLSLT